MTLLTLTLCWSTLMSAGLAGNDSGAVRLSLEQLRSPLRILYVAAHPDDENTRLISYFTAHEHARVAYLSLTRGEGGQNRIGTEQGVHLGVLRTGELAQARAIDGGEQFFTRAVDFGYSKTADETLNVWGHDSVLKDAVFVVRRFRPHVIITRFPEEGRTHGHHLASARIAREAFYAAANPKKFPDQLVAGMKPWKTSRLLFNEATWMRSEAEMEGLSVDISAFIPSLGVSIPELAATSRSNHKSQGFGTAPRFDRVIEWFKHLDGSVPKVHPLDGLPRSWNDVAGGAALAKELDDALRAYDRRDRKACAKSLVLAAGHAAKLEEAGAGMEERIVQALLKVTGLRLDALVAGPVAVPGEELSLELVADDRGGAGFAVLSVSIDGGEELPWSDDSVLNVSWSVPRDAKPTRLPWSDENGQEGWWKSRPNTLGAQFTLRLYGQELSIRVPIVWSESDRVLGERRHALTLMAPITVDPGGTVRLFPRGQRSVFYVEVTAHGAGAGGELRVEAPPGWTVRPDEVPLHSLRPGERQRHGFEVELDDEAQGGRLQFTVDGRSAEVAHLVDHSHVSPIRYNLPAQGSAAVVELAPEALALRVGYVPGSGDRVGELLADLGVAVSMLSDDDLAKGDLSRFDAILVGVRAFNVRPELFAYHQRLLDFAAAGGTVLVQYQTNNRLDSLAAPLGPDTLEISWDRVTDENAPVRWLAPKHRAMTTPHRLTEADFTGWVQERGLYFASAWGESFEPLFEMADPGEPAKQGALLVAAHGKGHFVYSGVSFFRQLPEGVPGAYRLLLNLLAL